MVVVNHFYELPERQFGISDDGDYGWLAGWMSRQPAELVIIKGKNPFVRSHSGMLSW